MKRSDLEILVFVLALLLLWAVAYLAFTITRNTTGLDCESRIVKFFKLEDGVYVQKRFEEECI